MNKPEQQGVVRCKNGFEHVEIKKRGMVGRKNSINHVAKKLKTW